MRKLLEDEPGRTVNHFEYDEVVSRLVDLWVSQDRLELAIELLQAEILQLEAIAKNHAQISSFGYTLKHFRDRLAELEKALAEDK